MLEKLNYVDARELLVCPLNRPGFLVDEIIPTGVHMLCGDEKTGKSWMMLDLCISIAEGTEFLGYPVQQGEVAYFCLEDTLERMQDRLFLLTDVPFRRTFAHLLFIAYAACNGSDAQSASILPT